MNVRKVLNVSSGDLVGSRFNGFDWHLEFQKHGVDTSLAVHWNHNSNKNWVFPVSPKYSTGYLRKFSRNFFLQSLKFGSDVNNYPWSSHIFHSAAYKEADLVHLQVVHDGTLDIKTIKKIIDEKPVVWTWHDPWPMTGHCIYPMSCARFQSNCDVCPDLARAFPIGRDLANSNFLQKKLLWNLDFTLHVSTDWFKNFVLGKFGELKPQNLVVLPFGLDTTRFTKSDTSPSRERLGIKSDNFVIGIRSVSEYQKNFELFVRAIKLLPNGVANHITIVTIQNYGQLGEIDGLSQVIELPWTNDPNTISDFYNSMDLFVMPSRYETFGFMSLEAMAHGVPVMGLRGTAIDEICNLEENGFIVERNSPIELAEALTKVFSHQQLISSKSEKCIAWVEEKYDLAKFVGQLFEIYENTYDRFWDSHG
jgi:glycosyltransferase involved in cell wall biosynthesis